jgi:hypothetical protein
VDVHSKAPFDVLKKPFERELRRIATRGVVKLFKTITEKQKEAEIKVDEQGRTINLDWERSGGHGGDLSRKKRLTDKKKAFLKAKCEREAGAKKGRMEALLAGKTGSSSGGASDERDNLSGEPSAKRRRVETEVERA